MQLNHLDLAVHDVAAHALFFQSCFDLTVLVDRGDFCLLSDGQGFALVLSRLAAHEPGAYPRGFHLGFNVDTVDAVHHLHKRVLAAGIAMARDLAWLGGALTFQCVAPSGVLVEVAHRPR